MQLEIVLTHSPSSSEAGPNPCAGGVAHYIAELPAQPDAKRCLGEVLEELLRTVCRHGQFSHHGEALNALTSWPAGTALWIQAGSAVAPARQGGADSGLLLCVHSGQSAGALYPLPRGRTSIGRRDCDVQLNDPDVSRAHAVVDVDTAGVHIEDRKSVNGLRLNGRQVRRADITIDSRIELGGVELGLHHTHRSPPPLLAPPADIAEPIEVSRDGQGRSARLWWLTACLPLIAGIVLAMVTGSLIFLALTAASTLMMLVPALDGRSQAKRRVREWNQAMARDLERRLAATPPLSTLTLNTVLPPAPERSVQSPILDRDQPPPWIRWGQAGQAARITGPKPKGCSRVHSCAPVATELRTARHWWVQGSSESLDATLRSLLLQLTLGTSGPPRVWVIAAAPIARWARLLPAVQATTAERALASAGEDDVVLIDVRTLDESTQRVAGRLRTTPAMTIAFDHETHGVPTEGGRVSLGRHAVLETSGTLALTFSPDAVDETTFQRVVMAQLQYAAERSKTHRTRRQARALPRSVYLHDVEALGGTAARPARGMSAIVGVSHPHAVDDTDEPGLRAVELDLAADGPHALIAGTTGAGKSELLRTLITSITSRYGPQQVGLALVDFKGGAAFAQLAELPHVDALVTDLDTSMPRLLRSLRAEVQRRERLLGEFRAIDIVDERLPDEAYPGRLLVVIDEFRIMVDHHPEALDDLVRIAAQGRSLGIHLVLATQRARGAVSADIRANTAIRIALRVQSVEESLDIIDDRSAADLPSNAPGRALLRCGEQAPLLFHSASTQNASADVTSASGQNGAPVATLCEVLEPSHPHGQLLLATVEIDPKKAAAPTAAPKRRPILPPALPENLTAEAALELSEHTPEPDAVLLGATDRPELQSIHPLTLRPVRGEHLGILGVDPAATTDAAARVLSALTGSTADGSDAIYLLDADGSLGDFHSHPAIAAVATTAHPWLAVEIMQRLAERTPSSSAVLFVHGFGEWLRLFRDTCGAAPEDLLERLLRSHAAANGALGSDGRPAGGLAVVLTGDRDLLSHRSLTLVPERLYLPHPTAEVGAIWPRLPAVERVPGRVVLETASAKDPLTAQLLSIGTRVPGAHVARSPAPFRMAPLPRRCDLADLLERASTQACIDAGMTRGPGTDRDAKVVLGAGMDFQPVSTTLAYGRPLFIVGPSRSGRSNLLRVLAQQLGEYDDDRVLMIDDADLDPDAALRLAEPGNSKRFVLAACSTSALMSGRLPQLTAALAERRVVFLGADEVSVRRALGVPGGVDEARLPGRGVFVDSRSLASSVSERLTAFQVPLMQLLNAG